MQDLRTDWLTGRTVLVAENRALRPNEFNAGSSHGKDSDEVADSSAGDSHDANRCPFCPGNEFQTPPPEYEQLDESGHWRLRVIPNKYPALSPDFPLEFPSEPSPRATFKPSPSGRGQGEGALLFGTSNVSESSSEERGMVSKSLLSTCVPAFGAHEVLIETARHISRTTSLSPIELSGVFEAYANRLRHWQRDSRLAFGLVFKNQGARAGASIAHLHSQLLAVPMVPPAVEAELTRAATAFQQSEKCPFCQWIEEERRQAVRIVFDHDGYVAICPFASLQPYEIWILPARHEPSFEHAMSAESLPRLTNFVYSAVERLEAQVPGASFNLLLRTAPWRVKCDNWFHWRIELLPRINPTAGLESATGIYINPVAPERAAKDLQGTV